MTAKLTGFGLAQAATGGGGTDFGQRTHVSQSYLKNTIFGAEEYMPPEFKDVMPQLSTKGDIFAFGVVHKYIYYSFPCAVVCTQEFENDLYFRRLPGYIHFVICTK